MEILKITQEAKEHLEQLKLSLKKLATNLRFAAAIYVIDENEKKGNDSVSGMTGQIKDAIGKT